MSLLIVYIKAVFQTLVKFYVATFKVMTANSVQCLHGTAPSYLADSLHRCAGTEGRRRLRSSVTDTLVVPLTKRSTLGDRAFPVAASRAWNGLPASIRTATSLHPFPSATKDVPVSTVLLLTLHIPTLHCSVHNS